MGLRDRLSGILPTLEDGDGDRITVVEPDARSATANIVIGVGVAVLAVLLLTEISLIPDGVGRWFALGGFLSLLVVNPIVRLPSTWEAIVILLMYGDFVGYMIVFELGNVTNALLISTAILIVVVLLEFPRRFSL